MAYLVAGLSVISLGCGSGRDLLFFARQGLNCTGVDYCKAAVSRLRKLRVENAEFICQDVAELNGQPYDVAYARFLLHSMPEEKEDALLSWCAAHCRTLCIEARSDRGAVPDRDHYRRLINSGALLAKLSRLGFTTLLFEERDGLSPVEGEDPVLIDWIGVRA